MREEAMDYCKGFYRDDHVGELISLETKDEAVSLSGFNRL